jgi:hypothetical protein
MGCCNRVFSITGKFLLDYFIVFLMHTRFIHRMNYS